VSALEQVLKKIGIFNSGSLIGVGGLKSSSVPYRLQKGLEKINPSKIYFQQEKPLILFFDSNDVDEKSISKKIWNLGGAPIVVFIKNELISIHNGFLFDPDKSLFNLLDKKSQNLQPTEVNLSFWDIVSGKRWLELSKKTTKNKVDERLLDNIQEAQKILVNKNLDRKIANSLIGRLLFARYLLDRDVRIDDDNCFFTDKESFLKLIVDKERLYTFFDYLKDKFNGDLFPVENQEKESIVQEHLDILRNLFEGTDIATKQRSLFDLYDFNIIPIELISEVYERFMGVENQRKEGAYYTPTFLVDYILQKTVRKHLQKQNACKVFDPSCGSGIFLVEALRCIIEKTRKEKELTRGELTTIIKDNIFGVDKDESAANITIFSLYLTLLDYQNPKDISTFKFPNLKNENIFVADFFDLKHPFNEKLNEKKLDFILGNPPWKSDKDGNAHIQYYRRENIPVSDKQLAQTFTVRVKDFSSINTSCALVITSKIFYNHNANGFRSYLLEKFHIDEVLELSPVRKQLFKKATAPSSILFYKYAHDKDTKQNTILHTSVKPNIFLKYLGLIVIEKNDIKRVQQAYFQKYDWLWKVLLYGSVFDFYLLKKIKSKSQDNILNLVLENSLFFSAGFKRGNPKKKIEKFKGYSLLQPDEIAHLKQNYLFSTVDEKFKDLLFEDDGVRKVYQSPHLVLKRSLKYKPVLTYLEKECAFPNTVFGIHTDDKKLLKSIGAYFSSSLIQYFLFLTSTTWGIEREEVLQKEYKALPWIFSKKEITKLSILFDEVLSIAKNKYNEKRVFDGTNWNKQIEVKIKEINFFLEKKFELNSIEKNLIKHVYEVSIPLFFNKNELIRACTDIQMREYAQNFMDYFGKQWNGENGKYFEIDIYSDNFIMGMNFKVTPHQRSETIHHHRDNDNDKAEQNILKSLSQVLNMGWEEITDQFIIQRDIRGFEKHSFYIIKPNEYKNWHPAVAQADLQEFIKDMLEAAEVDGNE
jgi:type I restriction-modification system DNA methylase subunit